MDGGQSSRQEGVGKSQGNRTAARELDEKMRNAGVPTISLLARSAALLPSGIVRVEQLRDAAVPGQPTSSAGSATGNPRNKTALAPGHSLMDWIRLGASGLDLTGVGGKLLTVTPAELARHNKEDDAWIAIRGIVFNVTRYTSFHPGGVTELMKGVGKDATKLFDDVHAWVNYQSILQKCLVGRLEHSTCEDLHLEISKDKSKKSVADARVKGVSPDPANLKINWRQTSSFVSLFYSWSTDNPAGECQIKRLSHAEFSLRIILETSADVVKHNVKLAEEVEWPPICKRSYETTEMEISFKKKSKSLWKMYGKLSVSNEKEEPTKRTYNEYEVLENTRLCKIVHLLVLRAENYIQLTPPGRHVEVKMDIMGMEVSRSYTPIPSSLHPEDRPDSWTGDDCLCLAVKCYEDGALTPTLTTLQPGRRVVLSCSLGDFRPEPFDGYTTLHMLAAGTGLTAMLSLVQRALSRRSAPNINLINFNRNEDSIFYAQQLERVSRERTLTVTHVLSHAESTWSGRTGTVSEQLLKNLIGEPSTKACIFSCGPLSFMKLVRESLEKLGWEPTQIYQFDG